MWILETAENPRQIEWNAYKIPSQAHRRNCRQIFHLKLRSSVSVQNIRPKNPSKKSVQKIRPRNPSKKSVQKLPSINPSQYLCHFVIAAVPIGCVSARPVLKTPHHCLNVFMGSMATLHEGRLTRLHLQQRGSDRNKKIT